VRVCGAQRARHCKQRACSALLSPRLGIIAWRAELRLMRRSQVATLRGLQYRYKAL
jgi:hypothetical protein